MIFAYLDLLDASLLAFLVFFGAVVTALIAGISFHEFSHAVVADSLGDPTARRMGRIRRQTSRSVVGESCDGSFYVLAFAVIALCSVGSTNLLDQDAGDALTATTLELVYWHLCVLLRDRKR